MAASRTRRPVLDRLAADRRALRELPRAAALHADAGAAHDGALQRPELPQLRHAAAHGDDVRPSLEGRGLRDRHLRQVAARDRRRIRRSTSASMSRASGSRRAARRATRIRASNTTACRRTSRRASTARR